MFKKFIVVVEVGVHESRMGELANWEVLPEDYVRAQVTEHLKDGGHMVRAVVHDIQGNAYETLNHEAFRIGDEQAKELLEMEILSKTCPSGVCDD